MVDDARAVLAWAAARGRRVVAVGLSAGAHLVTAATFCRPRAPPIAAALLCSGTYDLEGHAAHEAARGVAHLSALGAAFAGDAKRRNSPLAAVASPPARAAAATRAPSRVVVAHDPADAIVPYAPAAAFAAAVAARGARADLVPVVGGGQLDYVFRASWDDAAPFLAWAAALVRGADAPPR